MSRPFTTAITLLALGVTGMAGATQPLAAFARMPNIQSITLSPDGRQVAIITASDDRSIVVVEDAQSLGNPRPLLASKPGEYDLNSCDWVSNTRLLCSVKVMDKVLMMRREIMVGRTRLIGVNSDGSGLEDLSKNAVGSYGYAEDHVLGLVPGKPDTVLIQRKEDPFGFAPSYPSVYELDVSTGKRTLKMKGREPISAYVADAQGEVRVGTGVIFNSGTVRYYVRPKGEKGWRLLKKVQAFDASDPLEPIAMAPGEDQAYAIGDHDGRSALWLMDLGDQQAPRLLYSNLEVDVSGPLLTPDRQLIGVMYETDRPSVSYVDDRWHAIMEGVNRALPETFNVIAGASRDHKVLVIRARSDVNAGSYYLLDTRNSQVRPVGTAYPELKPELMGRMRSISYKAADGTEIPGYLTVPVGAKAEKLPLIVMPHGGPIARDSWGFDFLRAFLVDRGYAVLQMNFRGSSGYGSQWRMAAHQDWGGLTYSDVTDATRWAVAQGISDPQRMCILGWSFGGYVALLGAVRNHDLYRCAVSIAGLSDLSLLQNESRGNRFATGQITADKEKLRKDSPLQHVEEIAMPVLLVHGDRDLQSDIEQSRTMEAALKGADKSVRAVYLEGATHQLDRKSDRVTLLTEVENFLHEHLGPGGSSGSAGSRN